jgi:hypothetical protein
LHPGRADWEAVASGLSDVGCRVSVGESLSAGHRRGDVGCGDDVGGFDVDHPLGVEGGEGG